MGIEEQQSDYLSKAQRDELDKQKSATLGGQPLGSYDEEQDEYDEEYYDDDDVVGDDNGVSDKYLSQAQREELAKNPIRTKKGDAVLDVDEFEINDSDDAVLSGMSTHGYIEDDDDNDGLADAYGNAQYDENDEYEDEEPLSPQDMANKLTIGAIDDDNDLIDDGFADELYEEKLHKNGYQQSPQADEDAEYEYYDDDDYEDDDDDNVETGGYIE